MAQHPSQDPRSLAAKVAPGITRRAALAFVGAGAGFGIAAADKLWREGWPAAPTASPNSEEIAAVRPLEDTEPNTIDWAKSLQGAPDARLIRDADAFLKLALRTNEPRVLLPGCHRLLELSLAGSIADADATLLGLVRTFDKMGAPSWIQEIQRRAGAEQFPRTARAIRQLTGKAGR